MQEFFLSSKAINVIAWKFYLIYQNGFPSNKSSISNEVEKYKFWKTSEKSMYGQ